MSVPVRTPYAFGRSARLGLKAVALWIGVEVGVVSLGGLLALALSIPLHSGGGYAIERAASAVATVLLGLLFHRWSTREKLKGQALGYAPVTYSVTVAGLAAGLLLLLSLAGVTGPIDRFLFPDGAQAEAELTRVLREGRTSAAILLFLDNAFLVPIVEEYAWRGYIQTRLVQGLGIRNGVVVTALLFATKHLIADVSLFRLTTLLMASFAFGLLRVRWGTTVTTIAHLLMNLVATSVSIVQAFG